MVKADPLEEMFFLEHALRARLVNYVRLRLTARAFGACLVNYVRLRLTARAFGACPDYFSSG